MSHFPVIWSSNWSIGDSDVSDGRWRLAVLRVWFPAFPLHGRAFLPHSTWKVPETLLLCMVASAEPLEPHSFRIHLLLPTFLFLNGCDDVFHDIMEQKHQQVFYRVSSSDHFTERFCGWECGHVPPPSSMTVVLYSSPSSLRRPLTPSEQRQPQPPSVPLNPSVWCKTSCRGRTSLTGERAESALEHQNISTRTPPPCRWAKLGVVPSNVHMSALVLFVYLLEDFSFICWRSSYLKYFWDFMTK